MNKYKGILAIVVISTLVFGISTAILANQHQKTTIEYPDYSVTTEPSSIGGTLEYTGRVTLIKTDALTGKKTLLADNKHNLIVNNGLTFTRQQIGNGSAVASASVKYMTLSEDATGVDAADTNIDSELTANNLGRAAATYAANGTGAWNYTYEWTSGGTENNIQKIGINYGSSANDGTLFAELTFTPVNLLINDKLQAIWSQSIVSS